MARLFINLFAKFFSLSLFLSRVLSRFFPLGVEFRSRFPLRFRGGRGNRGRYNTLGRGLTGVGGGGRYSARRGSSPGGCAMPPSSCSVLQRRSLLIAGDVLPRALPPLRDSSSRDRHFFCCFFSSSLLLFSAHPRLFLPLALAFSRALSLLSRGDTRSQHPRYTATRSGVAALASSPAVSARRRNSFLPASLPALLPTCL